MQVVLAHVMLAPIIIIVPSNKHVDLRSIVWFDADDLAHSPTLIGEYVDEIADRPS